MADGVVAAERDRTALSPHRQLVLWSLRLWVVAYHRQCSAMPALESAYAVLKAPEAPALLNRMMTALGAASRRQIDVRPPCYRELSDDECRLLDMLALAQRDHADGHRFLLLSLVKPRHRQPSASLVGALARRLLHAGIDLNRPAPDRSGAETFGRGVAGRVDVIRCQVVEPPRLKSGGASPTDQT